MITVLPHKMIWDRKVMRHSPNHVAHEVLKLPFQRFLKVLLLARSKALISGQYRLTYSVLLCCFIHCKPVVIADAAVTRVCFVSYTVFNSMEPCLAYHTRNQKLNCTCCKFEQVCGDRRWVVQRCWCTMSLLSCLSWPVQVINVSHSMPSCYLPQKSLRLSSISVGFLKNWSAPPKPLSSFWSLFLQCIIFGSSIHFQQTQRCLCWKKCRHHLHELWNDCGCANGFESHIRP